MTGYIIQHNGQYISRISAKKAYWCTCLSIAKFYKNKNEAISKALKSGGEVKQAKIQIIE